MFCYPILHQYYFLHAEAETISFVGEQLVVQLKMGLDSILTAANAFGAKSPEETRKVDNPREAAAYTFGYNHSLFANRVHDLLTLIAFTRNHELTPKSVALVGIDGSGHWAAAARAQARDAVDRCVLDTEGFRWGKLLNYRHPDFTPGGAKYFDLPGMLSLSAPSKLMVTGETAEGMALVRQVYQAAEASDALTIESGENENLADAAVEWLLK